MSNVPTFKEGFKYNNTGNVVGTLVYAKEMTNGQNEVFGHEFLINAKGFGSVNVRVPKLEKSNYALNNYSVADKPRVRMGLTTLTQFVTDQGKVYTNTTSYLEMADPVKVDGSNMTDIIAGRLEGEVFNVRQEGNVVKFHIVTYDVDKNGNRIKLNSGDFKNPDVIALEIHEPQIAQDFLQKVNNGSNVAVGYAYVNKDDITYDDYGFPQGTGAKIERVEVRRLQVHGGGSQQPGQNGQQNFNQNNQGSNPFGNQQQQNTQNNPFGGQQQGQQQQQGNPFGGQQQQQQQQNPFGNQQQGGNPFGNQQQQQQGNPFGNQQNSQDPFGGQTLPSNDPLAQQANQIFNQGNQNPFPFGS